MKKLNLAKKDLVFVAITGLVTGLYLLEKSFSKSLKKEIEKHEGYLNTSLDQFDELQELYKEKISIEEDLIRLQDKHLMMLDPENYESIHKKVVELFPKEES